MNPGKFRKEFQTEEPGRSLRREHIYVFRLATGSPNFFLFPSLHKVYLKRVRNILLFIG